MPKLSRKKENRTRMLRNLASSLILHESITTTLPKAKAVKPLVKKLLTYAQTNNLYSRRQAKKIFFSKKPFIKLFEDIPPRIVDNNVNKLISIYKVGNRLGDNSKMAQLKLNLKSLEETIKQEEKEKRSQKKSLAKKDDQKS